MIALKSGVGGISQPNLKNLTQCVTACNGPCLAVDFKRDTMTCVFHNTSTACGTLVSEPLTTHIKRTICKCTTYL